MKHLMVIVLTLVFLFGSRIMGETIELNDEKAKLSYSIGYQVGGDFKRQGINLDPDILLKGIQDALKGSKPLLSNDEMRSTLINLQKKITAAREREMKEASEKNLAEGNAFLSENKKKEGVITTSSGLQYKIISEGSGKSPSLTDTVTVHYRGRLIDGTEFDSSYKRGQPATFHADRVIKGWQEALQMMKEGAKWQLFIPPALAYGQRRTGKIGPNSTLIFDVELLKVESVNK